MLVQDELKNTDNPFHDLLSLHYGGNVVDLIPSTLLRPVKDLIEREGKRVRGQLVHLGYEFAHPLEFGKSTDRDHLAVLGDCVEYLHAGSLAIDDVQDGSKLRRGKPALHLKYGLPTALNTGNWLYFWPLEKIRDLGLPLVKELEIYRVYHRTVVRAHMGQALDVGLSIHAFPQERVAEVCLATMELKSGALFSLALSMGAVFGGASPGLMKSLDEFGHGFGLGLQMFDDLGNMKGQKDPVKRWEDLSLRRPTWVWALAAREYSKEIYEDFMRVVQELPNDRHLQKWVETHDFYNCAVFHTRLHMEKCFKKFEKSLGSQHLFEGPLLKLKQLAKVVSEAYG